MLLLDASLHRWLEDRGSELTLLGFLDERAVSNDNVVQWDGRRFQIPPQHKRFSFAGTKVQLYESFEGKVAIYHRQTKLHHLGGLLLRG